MYDKKGNFNKGNNKDNNFKQPAKPINKTIPLVVTGNAGKGRTFDTNSLRDLLIELEEAHCFDKLSVLATMPKALVFDKPEARGTIGVARVKSYNKAKDEITVTFFGKSLGYADLVDDSMVITIKAHADRSGVVDTLLSFDIVNANDVE